MCRYFHHYMRSKSDPKWGILWRAGTVYLSPMWTKFTATEVWTFEIWILQNSAPYGGWNSWSGRNHCWISLCSLQTKWLVVYSVHVRACICTICRGGWKEVIKTHMRTLITPNFAESVNLSLLTLRFWRLQLWYNLDIDMILSSNQCDMEYSVSLRSRKPPACIASL